MRNRMALLGLLLAPAVVGAQILVSAPPGGIATDPGAGGTRDVLWDQPYDGTSAGVSSQTFPDFLDYNTFEFDDFSVGPSGWLVSTVTIYGKEMGDPGANQEVVLGLASTPDFEAVGAVFEGAQVGSNLVFTLGDYLLPPGDYWICAWVQRPFGMGGQWFWYRTLPVGGSEHWFHNPGGALGFGTEPAPGSVVYGSAADLAFKIEGEPAPPPPGTGLTCADPNCDGEVNAFDIDPFVLALTDAEEYKAKYPDCDITTADVNGDGVVNAFDIDPFVAALLEGSCCQGALARLIEDMRAGSAFTISSYSISLYDVFTEANREALLDLIIADSALPSLDMEDPANLKALKIADDPTIPPGEIAAYRAFLDGTAPNGSTLLKVTYDSPTAGVFHTYAICVGGYIRFEPLLYLITAPWPPVPPGPLPAACSGPHTYKNWLGLEVVRYNCCAHKYCQGLFIIGCDSTHEALPLVFWWKAEGTDKHEIIGNCCHAKCNFGFASGFKTLEIGLDGFSIKLDGVVGAGGTTSKVADDCCP